MQSDRQQSDRQQPDRHSHWRLEKYHGLGNVFLVNLVQVAPKQLAEIEDHLASAPGGASNAAQKKTIRKKIEDLVPRNLLKEIPEQIAEQIASVAGTDELPDGLIIGLCPFDPDSFDSDSPASSAAPGAASESATANRLPIAMLLRNADGSDGETSGNGLRCLAHAVLRATSQSHAHVDVLTAGGLRRVEVRSEFGSSESHTDMTSVQAQVGMGSLELSDSITRDVHSQAAWAAETAVHERIVQHLQPIFNKATNPDYLSGNTEAHFFRAAYGTIGNPHLVIEIAPPEAPSAKALDADTRVRATLEELGNDLTHHTDPPLYPSGINVELIFGVPDSSPANAINMIVWERGVGITKACGTGAVVAAAQAAKWGLVQVEDPITVCMPGGNAQVVLPATYGEAEPVLIGPSVWLANVKATSK